MMLEKSDKNHSLVSLENYLRLIISNGSHFDFGTRVKIRKHLRTKYRTNRFSF